MAGTQTRLAEGDKPESALRRRGPDLAASLLDDGEAEAVALARQLNAHWLLTDDTAARLVGQAFGLEVHGSLGIVLWAAATNRLRRDEAESALDRLAQSSLWVSSSVLLTAKAALGEMFP
jgi:predicted nucleic acid-binding protein